MVGVLYSPLSYSCIATSTPRGLSSGPVKTPDLQDMLEVRSRRSIPYTIPPWSAQSSTSPSDAVTDEELKGLGEVFVKDAGILLGDTWPWAESPAICQQESSL